MFLRRAAAVAVDGRPLLRRCYTHSTSAAALLPIEEDPSAPATLKYLDGFPRPDPKHDETILAIPRLDSGKAGRVPVTVFEQEDGQDGGNKRLISVRTNQVRKLVNHLRRSFFPSRLFELVVREGGFDDDSVVVERVRVLPGKLHLHSAADAPLNVTFLRAPFTCAIEGSSLNTIKRTAKFLCPADIIPPYIDMDLSELDVGQKLVMGDLKVHPALKLLQSKDELVCKIMGARVSDQKRK